MSHKIYRTFSSACVLAALVIAATPAFGNTGQVGTGCVKQDPGEAKPCAVSTCTRSCVPNARGNCPCT